MVSVNLNSVTPFDTPEHIIDPMSDTWRVSYQGQPSFPLQNWHAGQGGMHNTDLRMFQEDRFDDAYAGNTPAMLSPHLSYASDADWTSDYDVHSPSTMTFGTPSSEVFPSLPFTDSKHNLQVPSARSVGASSTHSPTSSYDGTSPQVPAASLYESSRPLIARSSTAPEVATRRRLQQVTSCPTSQKLAGSEGEEEDFVLDGDSKQRSRKRQRIPHTAVERRYREALNAGIKSLQATVVASKSATGGSPILADDKPSKSTILQSAIQHIQTLSADNLALMKEASAMKARLAEIEGWYASQQAGY
ncbi:uncharacterized protein K489DRAFT_311701 [Dissoconium aciculare CBS 342.82]|uniref:BHLH domain-containing protein n=1 Tax=Dissoconium aciculare CBS 342.82 TaxID=1314786 RepID=A0A6J3MHQ5_9PEZI|nr:uncharacterized protein K489DRAFT_311701 [Dissoconium aciculare CBS 342.82]KAF1827413.1 hypothetical protein K489DRAFT_311701 [Dissoconium aciculare CBS 342.82]